MKRQKRLKVLSLFICLTYIFLFSTGGVLKASTGKDLSLYEVQQAEDIIDQISNLELQAANILESAAEDTYNQLTLIKYKIGLLEKALIGLGVDRATDESINAMVRSDEAFRTNQGLPQHNQASILSATPGDNIINTYSGAYKVWQYSTTYQGKKQNHIIFQGNGNDPYLHKTKTGHIYNSISPNTTESTRWVNEVIKVYASKAFGSIPVVEWLPYELLGVAKPKPSAISSTGNATVVTLNAVTTQKFVFVWNESAQDWVYSLSVNKVNYSETRTVAMKINGVARNKSVDKGPYYINGDYNNASSLANTYSNGYEAVRCIDSIYAYSSSKDQNVISIDILTPRFVAHMLY